MAERTVSVRLRAVVDDYKSAMASAGRATQDVANQADKWKNLGRSTAALGDSLTRNVTLPIVAVGAAAVKMALDFDSAFQQMHQLAGVSAGEIDGMKESVLGLAGETGKAPQELAEALYFLRSSGLDGAAAMDALEMSAKASAAGMGSTVQVADAVSSAMNAYAESGLTAADATDVLIATAREGKAEPAELASQMGRLLPIASELGISFQDVGASIATLSLKGNDAAASSTLLQNVMQKLLRPSQQATEALANVGISADDIRSMIAEKGLLGTLETLRASLGESGFTAFWEDAQAVQGALGLVGGDIDATRDRFAALNDSAGDTNEAFGRWAETMGAKNAKAFAELQVAMIRIGDIIAPIASDVISFAADILSAFSKLPKSVQNTIVAFAGVAAALGPLLSVGGRVISTVSNIAKAVSSAFDFAGRFASGYRDANAAASAFSGTAGSLGGKLRGIQVAAGVAAGVAGIAGLALALKALGDAQQSAQLDTIAEKFAALGDASSEAGIEAVKQADKWGQVDEVFSRVLESGASQAERFIEMAEAAGVGGDAIDEMRAALEQKREADAQAAVDSEVNAEATREAAGAFDEETTAINQTVEALSAYADEIAAMSDPLFGLTSALQGNRDAQAEVAAKELELVAAREAGDPMAVAVAEQALTDARISAGQSAFGVAQAEATLAAALEEQPGLIANVNSMLDGFVAQGLITETEAQVLADRFGVLGERVRDVPEQAGIEVSETGADPTIRSIRNVEGAVEDVPRSRNTHVTETGSRRTATDLLLVRERAMGIPPRRNTHASTSGTSPARRSLDGVRDAGISIPGRRSTHTWTTGTGPAITGLRGVRNEANSIPRSVGVTVSIRTAGLAAAQAAVSWANNVWAGVGQRAHGGPVSAGRLYEVAERGRAELLEMGGRSYLIPGAEGNVVPAVDYAGTWATAGGGGNVYYNIDLRGAITPDSASLEKVVFRAIRNGGERGRPLTMRGRKL